MNLNITVSQRQPVYQNGTCRLTRFVPFLWVLIVSATACSAGKPRVLVLTETAGWDHGTRAAAFSAISGLGTKGGFSVDTAPSTDSHFTDAALTGYAAVCFVNTTGNIFTDAEAAAFERYMRAGGGYVGVHASVDAEYSRPWYGEMAGANFNGHPFNIAAAKIAVLDKHHSSTQFIAADTLTLTDEWYFWANNPDFRNNPLIDPATGSGITVLMDLVESSIAGSTLSGFHPICWCKNYGSGRVWYTGLGHSPQTFTDSLFKKMLLGGIRYAAGMEGTLVTQVKEHGGVRASVKLVAGRCDVRVFDIQGRLVAVRTADASNATSVGFVNNVGRRGGGGSGTGTCVLVASPGIGCR